MFRRLALSYHWGVMLGEKFRSVLGTLEVLEIHFGDLRILRRLIQGHPPEIVDWFEPPEGAPVAFRGVDRGGEVPRQFQAMGPEEMDGAPGETPCVCGRRVEGGGARTGVLGGVGACFLIVFLVWLRIALEINPPVPPTTQMPPRKRLCRRTHRPLLSPEASADRPLVSSFTTSPAFLKHSLVPFLPARLHPPPDPHLPCLLGRPALLDARGAPRGSRQEPEVAFRRTELRPHWSSPSPSWNKFCREMNRLKDRSNDRDNNKIPMPKIRIDEWDDEHRFVFYGYLGRHFQELEITNRGKMYNSDIAALAVNVRVLSVQLIYAFSTSELFFNGLPYFRQLTSLEIQRCSSEGLRISDKTHLDLLPPTLTSLSMPLQNDSSRPPDWGWLKPPLTSLGIEFWYVEDLSGFYDALRLGCTKTFHACPVVPKGDFAPNVFAFQTAGGCPTVPRDPHASAPGTRV